MPSVTTRGSHDLSPAPSPLTVYATAARAGATAKGEGVMDERQVPWALALVMLAMALVYYWVRP